MGLRSFLSRQPAEAPASAPHAHGAAEDPRGVLERLVDLGRQEEPDHPTPQFPREATPAPAAGISGVPVAKRSVEKKMESGVRRRGYVWLSDKSRSDGPSLAGIFDKRF